MPYFRTVSDDISIVLIFIYTCIVAAHTWNRGALCMFRSIFANGLLLLLLIGLSNTFEQMAIIFCLSFMRLEIMYK